MGEREENNNKYFAPQPQHGFARISRWQLEKSPERLPSGDIDAVFSLTDTDFTRQMWNCEFRVSYRLILRYAYLLLQHGLWSFQTGDTKLERFLPKNHNIQRKWLNFDFWINGELSKSAKIWFSKSIFYVKDYLNLSYLFFIEEYQFRSIFFVIDIFWWNQFLNFLYH